VYQEVSTDLLVSYKEFIKSTNQTKSVDSLKAFVLGKIREIEKFILQINLLLKA